MNKKEFIDKLAENSGYQKKECEKFFDAFIKTVEDALVKEKRVQFVGFGTFEVVERAEREGRNPQSGEPMTIKASKAVRFKAGSTLKGLVK